MDEAIQLQQPLPLTKKCKLGPSRFYFNQKHNPLCTVLPNQPLFEIILFRHSFRIFQLYHHLATIGCLSIVSRGKIEEIASFLAPLTTLWQHIVAKQYYISKTFLHHLMPIDGKENLKKLEILQVYSFRNVKQSCKNFLRNY